MKLIILAFLVSIFSCLVSAVVFLVKHTPGSSSLVKALTARITLSLVLFALLLLAFFMGWIKPHQIL
ncbi:MAG: DUF2909 domain-containing protein [Gammaproteobacteria bacterium]|nr:DUF2909 domain-containing protein [Gammaproteobacteria bacterium]